MKTHRHIPTALCTTAALLAVIAGTPAPANAQCGGTKLVADNAETGDYFGESIGISMTSSGPLMVVGAAFDTTSEGNNAGSVYTFLKINNTWGQTGQLFPDDLGVEFNFGQALAYADPYLIVGAPGVDTPQGENVGAVYVYERFGSQWENMGGGRMVPSWAAASSASGSAVDITTDNGGWAIVGAPGTDWDGNAAPGFQNPNSGAAFLYARLPDGEWGMTQAIWDYDASGSSAGQRLGEAVAIAGSVAVLGVAAGEAAPGSPDGSGYIKIFRKGAASWLASGPARFAPSGLGVQDQFGYAVDTDGTYIAVGCINRDSTAAQTPAVGATLTAGCVYMYKWNAATSAWDADGELFAQDSASGTQLGGRVQLAGGKLIAGSYSRHQIYTFRRLGAGNWVQESVIKDPEPGAQTSFGGDIAAVWQGGLQGMHIVATDRQDTRGPVLAGGAVFAFNLSHADGGNDACAGAKVITGGNHSGCTGLATRDGTSTCGSAGVTGGPDVWYSWTPSCSGNIIVDTFGSDYDTVLSIHSECPGGTTSHTIACDDDTGAGSTSLLTFDYEAGTTYLVRVGGYNGDSGNYTLRMNEWQTVPNNSCSSPVTVADGGTYTFSNCRASTDGPSATTCGDHMASDVWYVFTPQVTGSLKLDTCGSTFDTMLAIYSGAVCPNANTPEFACNDDATAASPCTAQTRTSNLSFSVLGGFPYLVRVGGYDTTAPTGDGVLHVNLVPNCACDWNLSGGLSVQDIFDFLTGYFSGSGDFNTDTLTSVQDIFDFLGCYFSGCSF